MKKLIFIIIGILFCLSTNSQQLHLYGGDNHDVYLGCITCNNYDSNSIWNEYGTYGSRYGTNSIWNKYGIYGSKYNELCPWNEYSSSYPVVVDKSGNFYGYFTRNKYASERANFKLALIIYKYYDLIRDDVSGWYKKINE